MKKLFAIPAIILLCFIMQIFYMRYVNESFFYNLIQTQSPYYEIKNVNFHKGFLNSKASFTLEDKYNLDLVLKFDLNFNNNYFAKSIAQGKLSNPFKLLDDKLQNKALAWFDIQSIRNDINISVQFQDINLSNEGGNALLENALAEILLDKEELKIKNIHLKIDQVDFSQFYAKLYLKNLDYKQKFDKPISFAKLIQLNESTEELKIDFCAINDNTFSSFYSKNTIYLEDDNQTLKMHSQGKANNLSIDFTSQIYQNIHFDQVHFDLIWNQKQSDYKFIPHNLSGEEINLQIQNITLKKENQDINIKGNILLSKQDNKADIQISSPKSPDEIFTWGQFFGGLNQYFTKNEEGIFIMDLQYDANSKFQLKINGNEFTDMDLN
ncbi:hypothetical protein B11476_14250 [Campylobacter coli]|nr:hypothetical protein B11476_14250 [Campylobacter coli]HDV6425649.1 hypothetical protein [Campylobacter coli]